MEPLSCYECRRPSDHLSFHYVGKQFKWGLIHTLHIHTPLLCASCVGKHGKGYCNDWGGAFCEITDQRLPLRRPSFHEKRLYEWLQRRLDEEDIALDDVLPDEARRYVQFSKSNFEQTMKLAGLEQTREVEPRWTRNRVGIEVCECRYLARIPGVKGYVLIGSSVDPSSQTCNGNATDRITLMLKTGSKKYFKRLNRVQNWSSNFCKAIDTLKKNYDLSNQPKTSTSSCEPTTTVDATANIKL